MIFLFLEDSSQAEKWHLPSAELLHTEHQNSTLFQSEEASYWNQNECIGNIFFRIS